MNHYVELEANSFLQRKIKNAKVEAESGHKQQIPTFPRLKNAPESPTFLGRLTRFVLNLTNPKNSTFYPMNYAWFANGKEVFGIKMLNKIKRAIGIEGLQGFGKLLTYMNYQHMLELRSFIKDFVKDTANSKIIKDISNLIGSPFLVSYQDRELGKKFFTNVSNLNKSFCKELVNRVLDIGQIELLRKMQNYSLSVNAEVDSYLLSSQIKSLNQINLLLIKNELDLKFDENALLEAEKQKEPNFGINKMDKNPSETYYQNLCQIFEDFGYIDTQHTFYADLSSETFLPILLACCTYMELGNDFNIDKKNHIVLKKMDNFDMFYYTFGTYSVLYQTGRNNIVFFISILSKILKLGLLNQYSLAALQQSHGDTLAVNKDTAVLQKFLQEFAYNCNVDLDYFGINFNNFLIFRNIANC